MPLPPAVTTATFSTIVLSSRLLCAACHSNPARVELTRGALLGPRVQPETLPKRAGVIRILNIRAHLAGQVDMIGRSMLLFGLWDTRPRDETLQSPPTAHRPIAGAPG